MLSSSFKRPGANHSSTKVMSKRFTDLDPALSASKRVFCRSLQPDSRANAIFEFRLSLEAISSLGFEYMTPVQASTIPLFMQHKDVVVEVGEYQKCLMIFGLMRWYK